jgi:hypothetical protein
MSLLKWFTPHRRKADPHATAPISSGLSRIDSTRPFHAARNAATAQPGNRKQERLERRELLYAVVREAMVRAGVLSSSYKFKVLSLDPRGNQFLVMVDLSRGAGGDTHRLAEIEAMIAQAAKGRYDIVVTAVYWRANDHVAVGDPAHPTHPANRGQASRPAPLEADVSGPAPLMEAPAVIPVRRPAAKFEPIHDDEVAAFRKALDAGVRGEQALAAVEGKTAHSYTLLTGFEDTEMAEGEAAPPEVLSSTQYGALR